MIIMQLNDISKSFGAEKILSNIKLEIKDQDRIAIVGRNGAGKSTLLKIMAGEFSYDEGVMHKPKDLTIGYLSQHTGLESAKTIWDEMLDVFRDLIQKEQELRKLEKNMEQASTLSDDNYNRLLLEYDTKQQEFITQGGYSYASSIKSVLSGLHFYETDYQTSISTLSGGQKTRLALGKLLLQKPALLILDEPTNHLDIETLGWLENYLASYPGAVTIVSHDRYFLDKTVSIVYEISYHKVRKYHGTYSKYLEKRALDYEQEMKEFEKQQSEIKQLEEFVQKNIVRASTTKRAQSRRKKLEKMDKLDRPKGDESSAKFSFDSTKRSGNDVLKINNLAFRYSDGDRFLFENMNLTINRGDSIALVGPNGIGKTTLLKMITGQYQPSTGSIQIGTNVEIGYYDQEQTNLNPANTVLQELWDKYPNEKEKDIRTVLGNFLFSGDDVLKPVHALSGGEKARLSLAKLMMLHANFLILDEPTNHLDIDSKEVLESALIDYNGTIIFVSHDRYFINKIAEQVVEIQADHVTGYLGDYDYYVAKKEEQAERERLQQEQIKVTQVDTGKLSYKEEKARQRAERKVQRRIEELENLIEERENELAALELEMTKPEVFQDHEKSLALTKETSTIKQTLEQLMEEWTELQE
ncbi:ABC-F family ATP-binding cassette domain-containing protein [Virgibacillus necropolis]|uniref:Multidrug ABC transporter ATP-binding protein n=1 Tax=Virgibacillus necropolis TaxID=163877 RepID=A0A221MHG3_9BACI|nr:ABC-F family ATP-binding cassette domain-containing protein [Virgibacillus necropolis]ASN07071.1 multidrug ABC transporter ATP-binding protein [Virgibacillus necropolis]